MSEAGSRPGVEEMRVERTLLQQLIAQARTEAPKECCGLLVGTADRISRAIPSLNVGGSLTRYLVNPADHFRALKLARADGLRVVGVYHSHPHSPPVPSETDVAEATYPDYLYVIVSLLEPSVETGIRGFRLDPDGATEVRLVVIE